MENYIIQNLTNEVFGSVRYSLVNGTPYFYLTDLCDKLGFNPNSNLVTRLRNGITDLYNSSKEHTRFSNTPGVPPVIDLPTEIQTGVKPDGSPITRIVNVVFINEPSVYYVIFQSRKPEANMFKSWVFSVLLTYS